MRICIRSIGIVGPVDAFEIFFDKDTEYFALADLLFGFQAYRVAGRPILRNQFRNKYGDLIVTELRFDRIGFI